MARGHNKPIEQRFMGKVHSWQIKCSSCPAIKVIASNRSSSLPPNAIIKKLRQAGWLVGNKAKDDLCPECYRRPVAATATQAKKALAQMAAPMVTNGTGHSVHYSEVEAIALKLPSEQMRQLIKALRDALPLPPHPKSKKEKVKITVESDAEYAEWLNSLKEGEPNGTHT